MIESKEITLVDIAKIEPWEKNVNSHPEEQLQRLEKIIRYQGFRVPLIISNRSGKLIAGHARLEVAKRMGMKQVPVTYQDFKDEDQEFSAMVADNSIGMWGELSLAAINAELPNLGIIDIDLLGIEDFKVDFSEKFDDEPKISKVKTCKNCGAKIS